MQTSKRLGAVLIAGLLLLSLSLAGCGKKADKNAPIDRADGSVSAGTHKTYHDGDFSAHSATYDADGRAQMITVSVRDGIITRVVFSECDEAGNDLASQRLTPVSNKSIAVRGDAYHTLENRLIRTQAPARVKAVSGAAGISRDFVALAKAALKNSRDDKNEGTSAAANIHKNKGSGKVFDGP